jgi:dihydrofolate reductase
VKLSLIVAMSENRVIGRDKDLPWHIPEDLKYFKKVTKGHPMIMGRKTFESIGRPLPQRRNIVLTRQEGFQLQGAEVFKSFDEALSVLRSELPPGAEVFVIGGEEIFRLALPLADKIYLTLVHDEFEGDAFFPEFDESKFIQSDLGTGVGELPHTYFTFERK